VSDVPSRWSAQQEAVLRKIAELEVCSSDTSMAAVRARYEAEAQWWNEGGPALPVEERRVPTRRGAVRATVARGGDPGAPVIVWIHGGGYIVGSPETHERLTRTLAHLTKATVVSVDYTLVPEARFPQPVEECVAVVRHIRAHADEWGVDGADITLAGDSAGATLAVATWLWLRDEVGDASGIRCLLLAYGGYGLRDSVSRRTLGGWWDGMTPDAMASWQAHYIDADHRRSPYYDVLAANLTGIPPCHVLATSLDPLLDDSRAFAQLLPGEGHELMVVDGVIHTFLQHTRMLDQAEQSLRAMAEFFATCGR